MAGLLEWMSPSYMLTCGFGINVEAFASFGMGYLVVGTCARVEP